MKIKNIDLLMKGELQKAVWSLFKQHDTIRASDIAKKLGRPQSNVTVVINQLVQFLAVEKCTHNGKSIRGLYKVKKGVTK